MKTGAEQRRLDAALSASASGVISSLTFLDAGRTVALGRSDRVASFWDVATGRELPRFEGRRAEPTNLAISPDGKYVALGNVPFGTPARPGGVSRAIHLWERATGAEAARSVGHTLPASSLVYSPDGTTLVSGSADGSARVWDAATGRHLRTFSGHVGPISCVAFGSGGRTIATASSSPRDRAISLWSVANGAEVRRLPLTAKRGGQQVKPGYPAGVIAMAFAPAGDGLATVVTDGSIRLWDAADGSVRADVRSGGLGVAFTRDGAHLLCGGADGLVRLLDARTGAVARVLKLATPPDATASPIPPRGANPDVGFRTRVTALTLTPDGTAFLAVTTDGSLRMWEIATGRYVSQIVLPGARGRAVRTEMSTALYGRSGAAFAPDARAVAVRGRDGMLYLVEMATGQPRCRLGDGSATVTALAFSPDGRTVAAAQSDSTLVVWDVNGAERPKTRLLDRELEEAWAGLGAAEAARAYRALCALANAPQSSVPYLGRVLRPAPPPDAKRLAGLIADLASESYPVRRKATEALELMGEPARGALTKALAAGPALEVTRRIEAILRGIDAGRLTPEQLRELRAIEALERIGSPAARNVLEQMAAGTDGLRITAEARASPRRLAGRGKGAR